jgi:hypothetical protein
MAVYKTKTYLDNARARPDGQNDAEELTMTYTFPAGVNPVSGDTILFGKIGENIVITQFQLTLDQFDSNATAALAGRLGTTASDACLIAAATVLQTNTTGKKNFARVDGEATAIDSFAVTPYVPQTTVQDLILTFSANAGTAFTTGNRNISLRIKYQYAYTNQFVTGVSDPRYPFDTAAGANTTLVFSPPVVETYNGNAP